MGLGIVLVFLEKGIYPKNKMYIFLAFLFFDEFVKAHTKLPYRSGRRKKFNGCLVKMWDL
jgi:hypothetical protein